MTDTITIELPREVAEAHGFGVTTREQRLEVDFACREALANPPTETPGLREAAQKFVDRWAHPDKLTADQLHHLVASLEAALSQTPEAAQPIPEAKSHDYPPFHLDRALEVVERVKAFVGGDIDPELASVSIVLADLDNLSLCLKLAAGEVEDPPPTAPEESEPVSESVDCSRGGDELIFEAEAGVKIVQRFDGEPNEYELVMPSGNRNIWFTDREAAIYCAQVVGSCWLEAEACGAMEEREAAANPAPSQSGESDTDQRIDGKHYYAKWDAAARTWTVYRSSDDSYDRSVDTLPDATAWTAGTFVTALDVAFEHGASQSGGERLREVAGEVVFASKHRAHDPISLHRLIQEELAAALDEKVGPEGPGGEGE